MCELFVYRKESVIVDNLTIVTIHWVLVFILILYSKFQRWVIDIDFIIGYSTVKIERVSDQYWFYYNFHEIEQQSIHLLILYIKCVSVVWEHFLSAHGAATALNR